MVSFSEDGLAASTLTIARGGKPLPRTNSALINEDEDEEVGKVEEHVELVRLGSTTESRQGHTFKVMRRLSQFVPVLRVYDRQSRLHAHV